MNLLEIILLLISLESGGNPNKVGDGGLAVGVLQIHPVAVAEANRINILAGEETRYTLEDRERREKSIQMASLILSFNIAKWRKRYGTDPSARQIMLGWRFTDIFKDPGKKYTEKVDRLLPPDRRGWAYGYSRI